MTAKVDWREPDYAPVYEERYQRLLRLRAMAPPEQALVHKFYASNPVQWVTDWGTTFDPRQIEQGQPASRPMILFPRQREFLHFMHGCNVDRKDGVVEKTREVGISWCAVHYAVHAWIYKPGAVIGMGSYEEDRVDKLGVMDSLLEKARHVLRNLPAEMRPPGLDFDKHLMHKRLLNPANGSQIVGEIGDKIGRGGRATFYIVDEYAFLKHPDTVDGALANTTECRIYISTANGLGAFYKKVQSPHFQTFRFEWRDDPRKDQNWYDNYRDQWGPEITAREVDIDHHASIENLVIGPRWIDAAQQILDALAAKGVEPRARKDYSRGVSGLDVGSGAHPSVFVARHGPYISTPIAWKSDQGNTTITAEKGLALAREWRTEFLHFDAPGIGAAVGHTLRHSGPELRVMAPLAPEGPSGPPADESPSERAGREVAALFAVEQPEEAPEGIPSDELVKARAINTGAPACDFVRWKDGRTSRESFANLRAEIWWTMRQRFENTYETWLWALGKDGGVEHDFDDLIILPAGCDQLKRELCGPTYHELPGGKVAIESKKDMAKRGVDSPDEADALALTYVPIPAISQGRKLKGYY